MLLGADATRNAILASLDALVAKAKPGDRVLIYYSGHGTSSLDEGTGGFGMDPATGAIVPADLDPRKKDILGQLIVGKRDLRPRLLKLEESANVLVIFDSCFSGESVKGIGVATLQAPRFVSLADLTRNEISSERIKNAESRAITKGQTDYPYKRVVYYSAASNNEYAYDITAGQLDALKGKFNTVDGAPHGAFTNALLEALNKVDSSQPKGICLSLFQQTEGYVVEQTATAGLKPQHPQMLAPQEDSGTGDSCFVPPSTPAPPPPPPPPPPGAAPGPASDIRQTLDTMAQAGGTKLSCAATRPNYYSGDETVLKCTAPEDGYVIMFSYGMGDDKAIVMLPNRYESGKVTKGEFLIPGNPIVHVKNFLPRGMTQQEQVMLVLFDTQPIDMRNLGLPEGMFTGLTPTAMKSVRSQMLITYDASEIVFQLRPKQ
jgi:hypothetical protein